MYAAANKPNRTASGRNPFPAEPFFPVPIKLYDCGLAADLTASQHKRYLTILRKANYHRSNSFQATLAELEALDGISPRRAHEIHPRLEEHGLILVDRDKSPYEYTALLPSEWRDDRGQQYPASRIPRSYLRGR